MSQPLAASFMEGVSLGVGEALSERDGLLGQPEIGPRADLFDPDSRSDNALSYVLVQRPQPVRLGELRPTNPADLLASHIEPVASPESLLHAVFLRMQAM